MSCKILTHKVFANVLEFNVICYLLVSDGPNNWCKTIQVVFS